MTGKVISEKTDHYRKITGSNQYLRSFLMKTVLLIFSFLVCPEASQIFAQTSELKVSSSSFILPVVLTQESTIESLDIKISGYNPSIIEKTDVSLTGGILENKSYSLSDNSSDDSVNIVLYAQSAIVSGKGKILFISFNIKAEGDVTLSLDTLELNEAPADGGFEISGSVSRNVKIVMNHAPVLDTSFSPAIAPIQEDSFNSQGSMVSEIIPDNSVTDKDSTPPKAIAVVSVDNTNGMWQYSLDNGSSWSAFTETSGASETLSLFRLLDSTDRIRFVPASDWNGSATFTFRAWDKTEGTSGGTADVSKFGGIYPFSAETDTANITVTPVNDAPVLDDSFSHVCYAIEENQTESSGTGISDIIADGSITDADGTAAEAIAVISADNSNGIWQYSLDNGVTWEHFTDETGGVAEFPFNAVLLGESSDKIRFVPNADWHGAAEFTFRAWDKSTGIPGERVNTDLVGGTTGFSENTDKASVSVGEVNDAPVLDTSFSPILAQIEEDDTENAGNSVSEIIADGSVTDIDGIAVKAIAVVSIDNTNGKWQYSTDNGSSWSAFTETSGASEALALFRLLDSTDRIRFIPASDWNGTTGFTFRAWDKTEGTSGGTADASKFGGIYPFSAETDTANITVTPINDAPVLDLSKDHILSDIAENNTDSKGDGISVIIADNSISDPDGAGIKAIAVISADNSNGIWQYSLDNGVTWKNFTDETGGVAEFVSHAVLLGESSDKIRFIPDKDWNGTASFTFRAWDKTSGSQGGTADTTENGGISAFSSATDEALIKVTPINNAPVLNDTFSPTLTPINEDDADNQGTPVSDIISDGSITDIDGSPTEAMAVISVDNTNGKWQYSLDNGNTWAEFTSQSGVKADISSRARLLDGTLTGDKTNLIRFVPNPDWYGTADFSFRAWDKNTGFTGISANISETGGTSSFSIIKDDAVITVISRNDAPILDNTRLFLFSVISVNSIDNKGNSIAELIPDGSITDPDTPELSFKAIAVISIDNTNGTWQYSTDSGVTWVNFTSLKGNTDISENARLLDYKDKIRFVPNKDWQGTAGLMFRAWDKSSGAAGGTSDASITDRESPFSKDTGEAGIEVNTDAAKNDAPVLDALQSPEMTMIDQGNTDNQGNSVSEIIVNGSVFDADGAAVEAMAITGADNTDGKWQYSVNNGLTWKNISDKAGAYADISTQAILLDGTLSGAETCRIRFIPNPGWNGTATFVFRAWDKSSGISGATADASTGGGESPFSIATDEVSIIVADVNDAPILDNSFSPMLESIMRDNFNSKGNSVAEIVAEGSITDPDGLAVIAVAVIGVDNTNGEWQYSLNNGKTWLYFSDLRGEYAELSNDSILLDQTGKIRFVPAEYWEGTATFTFRAWDMSSGKAGDKADTSKNGGKTPFSSASDDAGITVSLEINLNNAPVLDASKSPVLTGIDEDNFSSKGNTVAEIIVDGSITDSDGSPKEAIAVISVDNTNGKWEYSTDNGLTWNPFSDKTGIKADIAAQARLLSETHKIRFMPDENWNGTASFTFRAWDKSSGTGGATADATKSGGSSSFSLATDDAQITVTPVNDAPVLDDTKTPVLTFINSGDINSKGNTVAEIIADGSITDPDGTPVKAIAVIRVDNTNGEWQYSTDNGATWQPFEVLSKKLNFLKKINLLKELSFSLTDARLLDETHKIRFVPNDDWSGIATFSFRAWDKSSGTPGATMSINSVGGTSCFSAKTDDASITVNEKLTENRAPVLNPDYSPMLTSIKMNEYNNPGNRVSEIVVSGSITDEDGAASKAIAVIKADNSNGTWQYSLNNGTSWKNFSSDTGIIDISANAVLLDGTLTEDNTHKIRFVPNPDWTGTASFTFLAWDKSSGTAGETADATVTGGKTAFSQASDDAFIQVKKINNSPVLDATRFPDLSSITENEFNSSGNTVTEIFVDGSVSDADGTPPEAMAIIGVDNTHGKWQYSLDSRVTWNNFTESSGNVSFSEQARLLNEESIIRFIPEADWHGAATFRFRAWDMSDGIPGETANAGTGGAVPNSVRLMMMPQLP